LAILTSRILGVARDSIFARIFGVSALTDAYVAAFRIPNLLRDLFAEGALSSAFVPTFSDALEKGGRERAYRLGNLVLGGLLLITGALSLAGMLWADQLVSLITRGFGGNADQVATSGLLARIMMPILTLVSVSAVWMGMLNAQQRYLAPAYAPAMFNVTSIACGVMLMVVHCSERTGMVVWSVGTATAGLVQAVVQLPSLHRLGYRVRPTLAGFLRDLDVRRIARLMGPATVGLAAIQINVFVNTQYAAALGSGPLTYLQNAFRLFYLPVGLFGVALATVTTARASQEAARGDKNALIERVSDGVRGVWLLALPSAVGLVVLAQPVVQLLFQGGKFLPVHTAATVPIVQAYMLGVLPYSLVKVFAPAFFAMDRSRVPMIASIAAVAGKPGLQRLDLPPTGRAGFGAGNDRGGAGEPRHSAIVVRPRGRAPAPRGLAARHCPADPGQRRAGSGGHGRLARHHLRARLGGLAEGYLSRGSRRFPTSHHRPLLRNLCWRASPRSSARRRRSVGAPAQGAASPTAAVGAVGAQPLPCASVGHRRGRRRPPFPATQSCRCFPHRYVRAGARR
jgi:putative peptidoglycan lipid II flippase